jgi:uncharacterized protein (DUF934 family)
LDLSPDTDLASFTVPLGTKTGIRITFATFGDGRGFSLAAQLRRMGFEGKLRAKGHIISEQYAMARRAGFDEVEISDTLAARQPAEQWAFRADWRAHDYQGRFKVSA